MAAFKDITVTNNEYRACFVKGRKALFHRWYENLNLKNEILNEKVGSHIRFFYGVIEYENGEVDVVAPNEIRFCDRKKEEYEFSRRRGEKMNCKDCEYCKSLGRAYKQNRLL